MTLVLETNGKGYMGWIAELPGAFIRGATIDEVHRKIPTEFAAYADWLEIGVGKQSIHQELTVATTAAVEDGDTSILIEIDREPFRSDYDIDHYCGLMNLSGQKVQLIYDKCSSRDVVAPSKDRETFYGSVHSTVEAQYRHVVRCQQYYLESIGIPLTVTEDLRASRPQVVDAIRACCKAKGNLSYRSADEDWTARKVIRRIIWHDRIHGRAMGRMNKECAPNKSLEPSP